MSSFFPNRRGISSIYSSEKPAIPNSPKYNTTRTRTQPGKHEAGNTSKAGNQRIKLGSLSWVSVRSNLQRNTAYFWPCIGLILRTEPRNGKWVRMIYVNYRSVLSVQQELSFSDIHMKTVVDGKTFRMYWWASLLGTITVGVCLAEAEFQNNLPNLPLLIKAHFPHNSKMRVTSCAMWAVFPPTLIGPLR